MQQPDIPDIPMFLCDTSIPNDIELDDDSKIKDDFCHFIDDDLVSQMKEQTNNYPRDRLQKLCSTNWLLSSHMNYCKYYIARNVSFTNNGIAYGNFKSLRMGLKIL